MPTKAQSDATASCFYPTMPLWISLCKANTTTLPRATSGPISLGLPKWLFAGSLRAGKQAAVD